MAECLQQEPEELALDVDATEIEAEKQEAQWTYHKVKGYMPLVAYVNGVCVGHEFREGNPSPGTGILEFAQYCEAALPAGKEIYFRRDSAAYQAEVINHFTQAGRTFNVTADQDAAAKREIAQAVHTMNGTERAFRLIVLHWPNPQPNLFETERYCYHAVATNREESLSEVIWRHNRRGQCENWHQELKAGFGMEQMPCGEFEADAMYLAIGVLAYNLAHLLKRRVLPVSYRTVTTATLRWKLYRLAAKLVRHAHLWMLQIKTDVEKWRLLESAWAWFARLAG